MNRRSSVSPRRAGFTLVELLAATIVMAMLLAALVQVGSTSARQVRNAESLRQRHPSTSQAGEQIVRDVQNADGMLAGPDSVSLFGAIATDPRTGQGTHRLARVTYAVKRVQGLSVLVRTEQQNRGLSHQRVVWVGASAVSVRTLASPAVTRDDLGLTGGLFPMPSLVAVQMRDVEGAVIWSERVRHHREVR